ncbi:unnamed protein product [Anisakis simplex]|uniref:Kinesin motor domain-containing protein n=1 Tax=Anisakis simplex TaxID=6269 RepID=A0A0M3JA08_ANISI|nr:unnamed protein product [Anisakis simplex]
MRTKPKNKKAQNAFSSSIGTVLAGERQLVSEERHCFAIVATGRFLQEFDPDCK